MKRSGRALPLLLLLLLSPTLGRAAEAPAQGAPLTLEEALRMALSVHPQVRLARGSLDAASARALQARAAWLPQLGFSTLLREDYSYQTATGSESQSSFRYNAQLQAQQLIYDFGRTTGRIDAGKAAARAAVGDLQSAEAQVVLQVVTAYYAVLQAEALFLVAEQNLRQQDERLRQAESFFAIGTRPEIDVLTARTQRSQADLARIQARNGIQSARLSMLQALGTTDLAWLRRPLKASAPAPITEEEKDPAGLVEQALRDRPEYQALGERVRQAEALVVAARGDYLPQLSLAGTAALSGVVGGASVGTFGGSTRLDVPVAGQPGVSLSASLLLSWPVFSGLQTVYAVAEARAQLQVAEANLEALRQQLSTGLQQGLLQVANAREALGAAEAVRVQAELQLEMASGRYGAGVGNIIELGDAQVSAATARSQRVQADFNLAVSRAGLLYQLGKLVPAEGGRRSGSR